MGLVTYEDEVICSIPPAKLFKALVVHGDHLVPKVLPEAFKSIKNIEGDGGVGSIKLTTFGDAHCFLPSPKKKREATGWKFDACSPHNGTTFVFSGSQHKSAKHRVDEIDEANLVCKCTIIEGDVLGEDLESISYVVKIEPSADGGSVCKTVRHCHTKHDAHGITEDKIKERKEKAKEIFKAVEAHLHAHPDAC